jgi:hypothetical protein
VRSWRSLEGNWWDVVRGPWLLTFHSLEFKGSPGFIYLFFAPLAAVLTWRNRSLRLATIFAFISYLAYELGSKQVRLYAPLFPVLAVLVAAAFFGPGVRGAVRLSPPLRKTAQSLLVAIIVFQMPFFSAFRSSDRFRNLGADSLKLFCSKESREEHLSQRIGGKGVLKAHTELNDWVEPNTGILALTPLYQALLDHPVFMLPNRSPATQLTRGLMETALDRTGYVQLRLRVKDALRAKRLRIQQRGGTLKGWKSYRPRVFFESSGVPLERSLLRTGELDGWVVLSLAVNGPVKEIRFWEESSDDSWTEGELTVEWMDGEEWRPVPFELALGQSHDPLEVAELLRESRVSTVVYNSSIKGLEFLDAFFGSPESGMYFNRAKTVDGFRIFNVSESASSEH